MEKPEYPHFAIGSVKALAKTLDITEEQIHKIADNADLFYFITREEKKKDGGTRIIHDVKPQLKIIHQKIKERLLKKVIYPKYLQGGLAGKSYITDCTIHVRAKVAIKQDISSYFPSIQKEEIKNIWQYFFRFPPQVADLLAKLTTYQGSVPQGARTSTYLANLMFWEEEPKLFEEFRKRGIRYSRFVDDITVSAKRVLEKNEVTKIISTIIAMLQKHGLNSKRKKRKVLRANRPMNVHNLYINAKKPSLPKEERAQIETLARKAEDAAITGDIPDYPKIAGKVAKYAQLHERKGKKLKVRIRAALEKSREKTAKQN